MLDGRMGAMGVCDSPTTGETGEEKIGEAIGQMKSSANSKAGNTKMRSQASPAPSKGFQGGQDHNAAFAQKIGVIFCAMYNVFVDTDVLQEIQGVSGKLAVWIDSSEEWNSTEIGRLVHFADDRSQERVRDVLILYADTGLQRRCPAAGVKRERSDFVTKRIPEDGMIMSRCMGLASLRQKHSMQAYDEMVRKCEIA